LRDVDVAKSKIDLGLRWLEGERLEESLSRAVAGWKASASTDLVDDLDAVFGVDAAEVFGGARVTHVAERLKHRDGLRVERVRLRDRGKAFALFDDPGQRRVELERTGVGCGRAVALQEIAQLTGIRSPVVELGAGPS
jgi:hypothetical protein